ncbi:MAG TPA: ROK family protein [Anaerolineales bacterium]
MSQTPRYGGIEAGGTKFRCAVGSGPDSLLDEARFETRSPEETLRQTCEFFRPYVESRQVRSIGIGSFGPLDLQSGSPTFGFITSTPKPGWQNADIRGFVQRELGVEASIDTDVNAAALGEFTWGASWRTDPSLYLTVGTGIGGGLVKDGRPYHGLLTPEMGHIRIPHDLAEDPFPGACPFHGDCLEGLASGPAIERRTGVHGELLDDDHPVWKHEARYIALALANYVLTLSPGIIILGGGVMKKDVLLKLIREQVQGVLNGYVRSEAVSGRIEEFIVPPGLGDRAGVLGAIALVRQAEDERKGA